VTAEVEFHAVEVELGADFVHERDRQIADLRVIEVHRRPRPVRVAVSRYARDAIAHEPVAVLALEGIEEVMGVPGGPAVVDVVHPE